jgi:hypothetical protein
MCVPVQPAVICKIPRAKEARSVVFKEDKGRGEIKKRGHEGRQEGRHKGRYKGRQAVRKEG